jgi:hypothetical protein
MDSFYRILVPLALWLGLAAFVLGNIMMLAGRPFLFGLTPGGILNGAQALVLIAVGSYCALRAGQRS